jgi:hypothetical protein
MGVLPLPPRSSPHNLKANHNLLFTQTTTKDRHSSTRQPVITEFPSDWACTPSNSVSGETFADPLRNTDRTSPELPNIAPVLLHTQSSSDLIDAESSAPLSRTVFTEFPSHWDTTPTSTDSCATAFTDLRSLPATPTRAPDTSTTSSSHSIPPATLPTLAPPSTPPDDIPIPPPASRPSTASPLPYVRLCTYNIMSGRNSRLIAAVRAMAYMYIDIALITEVKITKQIYPRTYQGYNNIATDAPSTHQGGVAVAWRKERPGFCVESLQIKDPTSSVFFAGVAG